jgi:hypothetical protein
MSLRESELERSRARTKRKRTFAKQQKRKKKVRFIGIGIGHKRGPALEEPLAALLDDRVMTYAEWCQLNGIGIRTGYRILRGSDPPQTLQLTERRIGITVRANREWQQRRSRSRSTPR